jgi:serine/threonine protein kinase/Rieske Fe-S protein
MQTLSVDRLVGQVLGNYRVEQLLGRGRLNAVFLVRHVTTQKQGALTLFLIPDNFSSDARTRFLQRFHKASSALVALRHEHILPVYEGGEYLGYPFLVTPYMMNGSLADIIKRKGRLSHERVRSILDQVVAGLEYAHNKGVIHGTLRPSNVVLSAEQTMLVAGFGLMHIQQMRGVERSDQAYGHLMSIANTFLVAPEYIAPEIVQGQHIDKRSDVYALGAILFELLSGQPPFTGSDPLDVVKQHVERPVPSLRALCPDVPVALESVVNQALERDPARRFQRASELAEAFDQVSRGATGPIVGLNERIKPTSRQRDERVQPMPVEDTSSKSWQFTPPIVTGKVPAVPPMMKKPEKMATPVRKPQPGDMDTWQARPSANRNIDTDTSMGRPATHSSSLNISAKMPTVEPRKRPTRFEPEPEYVETEDIRFSAPLPTVPPQRRRPEAFPVEEDNPYSPPSASMSSQRRRPEVFPVEEDRQYSPPSASMSSQRRKTEMAGADEWWRNSVQPSQEFQLPPGFDDQWSPNGAPVTGTLGRRTTTGLKRPAGKTNRRKVVAFLASAGVAAAVGAFVVNSHLIQMAGSAMQQGAPKANNTTTTTTGTTKTGTQQKTTSTTGTQKPNGGTNSNTVGTTTLALNSAMTFTNPADKKEGVLIHLPDGNFVAYEDSCTHQGITVKYDPATHLLVCPLHGAIFNPAQNGAVVQEPEVQPTPTIKPLPKVAIKVNSDGTITAA